MSCRSPGWGLGPGKYNEARSAHAWAPLELRRVPAGLFRVRLCLRRGPGEGGELLQMRTDRPQSRVGLEVALEAPCAEQLRQQQDIRKGHGIPEAVAAIAAVPP